MRFKIVSYDMDGTLTLGTTCLQYYVGQLGMQEKAKDLETRYKNHELTDGEVADEYAKILTGISRQRLDEWTKQIPVVSHIKETVTGLKELGLKVGITSVGPLFASECFQKEYGFDFVSGSIHLFENNIHAGKMVKTLYGEDKVKIVETICAENNVSFSSVIAIGDSRSDVPIFEKVGFSIALNSDETLKQKANIYLQTTNLLDVYQAIRAIL